MAARRQRPDRAGHDAPERGIITPAPARSRLRPQFHFPAPPSPSAAPAAPLSAIVAEHLAVAQLTRHRNSTTVTPATPDVPHCPLF